MKFCLCVLLLVSLAFGGCVRLPAPAGGKSALDRLKATPAGFDDGRGNFYPAPASQAQKSPAHVAIQRTVNWLAVVCSVVGACCLAMAGLCAYGGQIWRCVRYALVGLLLPIFGVWFAYHWGAVVIMSILSLVGLFVVTHFNVFQPAISGLKKIIPAGGSPAPEN